MDKIPVVSKLNELLPGAILQSHPFGRSQVLSIWVEAQSVLKVAEFLRTYPDLKLNWLENLSVVEFDRVIVVTYFLRSTETQESLIVRASAVPSSEGAVVRIPSIQKIWPMGNLLEREAEEMFGVLFRLDGESDPEVRRYRLPSEWQGFPLRKSYQFPREYSGIGHARPSHSPNSKKPTQ